MFGSSSSAPAETPHTNFIASGSGVYMNTNGEQVLDTFRHVNVSYFFQSKKIFNIFFKINQLVE